VMRNHVAILYILVHCRDSLYTPKTTYSVDEFYLKEIKRNHL